MKNKSSKKTRSRAEILAEIAALPPSVQGTISSYKNVRKNGTAVVYYNLQYTHKGKTTRSQSLQTRFQTSRPPLPPERSYRNSCSNSRSRTPAKLPQPKPL